MTILPCFQITSVLMWSTHSVNGHCPPSHPRLWQIRPEEHSWSWVSMWRRRMSKHHCLSWLQGFFLFYVGFLKEVKKVDSLFDRGFSVFVQQQDVREAGKRSDPNWLHRSLSFPCPCSKSVLSTAYISKIRDILDCHNLTLYLLGTISLHPKAAS